MWLQSDNKNELNCQEAIIYAPDSSHHATHIKKDVHTTLLLHETYKTWGNYKSTFG